VCVSVCLAMYSGSIADETKQFRQSHDEPPHSGESPQEKPAKQTNKRTSRRAGAQARTALALEVVGKHPCQRLLRRLELLVRHLRCGASDSDRVREIECQYNMLAMRVRIIPDEGTNNPRYGYE
jgi:hypothetical protein